MLFLLASGLGVPLSSSTQSVQPELASVVHNTLLKSGIEQRVLDDILAANSTSSGAGIILTFLNEAAIPTWRRQLDLVKEQRLSSMLSRWVIINWDDAAMRACQESAVVQHCALDTQLLDAGLVKRGAKGVLGHEATYHDEKGGVLHQVYARMCWRRVETAALALWHGVHVTNLDTDVLTFREPFPGGGPPQLPPHLAPRGVQAQVGLDFYGIIWGRESGFNRECPTFACEHQNYNGGVWLAKAHPTTIAMINDTLATGLKLSADAYLSSPPWARSLRSGQSRGCGRQ